MHARPRPSAVVDRCKRVLVAWPPLFRLARSGWRRVRAWAPAAPEPRPDHWSAHVAAVEHKDLRGWLDWPIVEEEYVRPQVSGDPAVGYLEHFVRSYLPDRPVARLLSLGCGGGNLERDLAALDAAVAIEGIDASERSIELARALAREQGLGQRIRYQVADVNDLALEPARYDAVVAKQSLHHFEELEAIYREVRRSLVPGGVFMLNEYVGPSRFQWTDVQLAHANEWFRSLPPEIRKPTLKIDFERPTPEDVRDPTEAVRSAEILSLLEREFELVEYRPYGGAVLHLLLDVAMPHFDLAREDHLAVLRQLFGRERGLTAGGVLAHDFVFVVARPRSTREG